MPIAVILFLSRTDSKSLGLKKMAVPREIKSFDF